MIYLIAPYRNRPTQFNQFIEHYSKLLDKDLVKIIIFEQANNKPFNKGLLHNCGLRYLFDKIPLDNEDKIILNDIDCLVIPSKIEFLLENPNDTFKQIFGYKKIWFNQFNCLGGIFSFKLKNFIKINGFPNNYWGWGGEDLALGFRAKNQNFIIDNSKIIDVSNTKEVIRHSNPGKENNRRNSTNNFNLKKLYLETKKPILGSLNGINSCYFRVIEHIEKENYQHIKLDF